MTKKQLLADLKAAYQSGSMDHKWPSLAKAYEAIEKHMPDDPEPKPETPGETLTKMTVGPSPACSYYFHGDRANDIANAVLDKHWHTRLTDRAIFNGIYAVMGERSPVCFYYTDAEAFRKAARGE